MMNNYRTMMYDDLVCPCCVCEAQGKATMPTIPPSLSIKLREPTQDSSDSTNDSGPVVPERTSSITESLRSSHSSLSSRSFRLSMDGAINEYQLGEEQEQEQSIQEVQCCEVGTRSPRRHVSLEVPRSARPGYEVGSHNEWEEERKPKSLSRLDAKSPRQPRAQRRCSVTKFSLEHTLFQVQQEEQERSFTRQTACRLDPCVEEEGQEQPQPQESEPEPRRHRVRRRCSVTKYSLDDVLQVVQQEDAAMTNPLSPKSPEAIHVKDLQGSGHGLVATLESKRNFKARLPWGRAA